MTTESATKSAGLDWIIFFVSLIVTIALLIFYPQWFWVPLPFVLTYLVKALDMM